MGIESLNRKCRDVYISYSQQHGVRIHGTFGLTETRLAYNAVRRKDKTSLSNSYRLL